MGAGNILNNWTQLVEQAQLMVSYALKIIYVIFKLI